MACGKLLPKGLSFMTEGSVEENSKNLTSGLNGLGALESLQENASGFFQKTLAAYGNAMVCKAKCSACCHVSLDVFPSEAARILKWALALSASEQQLLKTHLLKAKEQGGRVGADASGVKRLPCVFLAEGLCAIYDARPVICRTQGAPLQLKKDDGKGNVTLEVDACPLNFQAEGSLPPPAEWLDLERLTVLQVLAERQFLAAKNPSLFPGPMANGRVALSEVRAALLTALA